MSVENNNQKTETNEEMSLEERTRILEMLYGDRGVVSRQLELNIKIFAAYGIK